MIKLDLYSEPFASTGNIAGEGFRNLLGRPALGLLQMVLREAIQNSIDAGRRGRAPAILIRYRTLSPEEKSVLTEKVLAALPGSGEMCQPLEVSLAKSHLKVLEICDFYTAGLGGPTRADIPAGSEESPDFVNFMRNVGATRDVHHGGGTYGYGKTSLYAMSACSTIIVDSQTTDGGYPERRFMGCHLGVAFKGKDRAQGSKLYTGRHWWGLAEDESQIEPVTGNRAAELASALDLPERNEELTGTTIMVVDPYVDGNGTGFVGDEMVETILWNFWPRMTATTPENRKLQARIEVEGTAIEIPAPESFPPLDLFASAMAQHRESSDQLQTVSSERPKQELGKLAIQSGFAGERTGLAVRQETVIPQQASHIALMRPVELVVRYLEGEPFADRRYEWAGVFVCSDDDEVERAFASSEPPAHDDWIPDMLPRSHAKTFVSVALRRLKSVAHSFAMPAAGVAGESEKGPSLAGTATRMGRLLSGGAGQGPGRPGGTSQKPSARKKTRISPARFVQLETDAAGNRIAVFEAELQNDGTEPDLWLSAEAHLVADGGAMGVDDLPDGFEPEVVEMSLGTGRLSASGPEMTVADAAGPVTARVRCPAEAAVGLRLRLNRGAV